MYLLKIIWAIPIVVLVFAVSFVFGFLPAIILRALGAKKLSDDIVHFHGSYISDIAMLLFGCRVHIEGDIQGLRKLTNSGKRVCLVANHTSMLDIPIVMGPMCIPCGFITKQSFKYFPVFNLICISLYCVFIDRKNTKRGVKAIRDGVRNIKAGHPMLIFPEGRRSKTGEIRPFLRGAFRLATMSGATLVPVVIKGARRALEDKKHPFSGSECYVRIGKYYETEGLNRVQAAELVDDVESYIKSEYDSMKGEI
ncbi:MAG: 1-acyl-sn-glycerol-3-phosphate acyltransferase [Sphaerochaetaceae bacterium]|nr:1-acyl-sn-glycerol-3-phosphate acyltransferase [Sphaerochaetaceae bacterium]